MLIVQSERDAATPYEGAVELHKRFKGSRLITEKDAGSHGVTGLVNPCINPRVDAYLLTGKLDSRGRDVRSARHAQAVARTTGEGRPETPAAFPAPFSCADSHAPSESRYASSAA